jgi:hypothetical protein
LEVRVLPPQPILSCEGRRSPNWSHRLVVRTPASHVGNAGSTPAGITLQRVCGYERRCWRHLVPVPLGCLCAPARVVSIAGRRPRDAQSTCHRRLPSKNDRTPGRVIILATGRGRDRPYGRPSGRFKRVRTLGRCRPRRSVAAHRGQGGRPAPACYGSRSIKRISGIADALRSGFDRRALARTK